MKTKTAFLFIALIAGVWAHADQALQSSEIFQLFGQLCQYPATGWISSGRIEANHRSYDLVSGEITETLESVTTDQGRFIWRTQIVACDNTQKSKVKDTSDFLEWNKDRTFIWDGQTYTLYFKPGNHAIVYENPSTPAKVNGPLTAGYIPWGQGIFTLENLAVSEFSAARVDTVDGSFIELSVRPADTIQMQFLLDPAKDNAVLSYTLLRTEGSKVVQTYGNFVRHQGRWVPMNIIIDRYQGGQLQSSDEWEIRTIEDMRPEQNSFAVSLEDKALVQHHSPLLDKPVFYRHSTGRDIKPLLDRRFMHGLKKQTHQKRNCGSVGAEQILSAFGIAVDDSQADSLVDASGQTTLYQIKQLIEQKGLYCLPVKTNLAGLEQFDNAQILLHFPAKKHFVVLDRIDQGTAWVIDLDRQVFYRRMKLSQLELEWAGIALVVSETPLSLEMRDKPVPDPILKNIAGAADYSCSELIQPYSYSLCPKMVLGTCGGRYTSWNHDIYGCKKGSGGGFCNGTGIIGGWYSPCIVSPQNPGVCDATGDIYAVYIRACLQ